MNATDSMIILICCLIMGAFFVNLTLWAFSPKEEDEFNVGRKVSKKS